MKRDKQLFAQCTTSDYFFVSEDNEKGRDLNPTFLIYLAPKPMGLRGG